MKRSAIYCRVSSDGQAGDDKVSLSEQEARCKGAITSKGYEYLRTYSDVASGKNMNREGLHQLIGDIESGDIEALFIYKLDRLSRSQRDTLEIIEDVLMKRGVELISLNESLDTSTPWGRCMIGVLSSFNQMERETIIERTTMGKQAKAKQGKFVGGVVPLGYRSENHQLIIVPEEAEVVRIVFRLREQGYSLQKIADNLNEMGCKTKKGGKFLHSAVQKILSNEDLYRGNYSHGEHRVENTHEAILD